MHIWSPSLCLALICFTSSVHSQCNHDSECPGVQVCCVCGSRSFCGRERRCKSDADCPFPLSKCHFTGTCISETPTSPPTTTWPDIDSCYWDSDCFGTSRCLGGQCVDRKGDYNENDGTHDSDGGGLSWSTTKIVAIVFFAAVAAVISCLYHMCKNARKPPVLATQNSQTATRVAGEGTNTAHGTDHELGPTGNAVSNGGVVIAMEEVNEVSPPLPPGAPPPYSTLEFEPQQRNENEEQPPPSYDEAVANSTMALV